MKKIQNLKFKIPNYKRGFTLIELLIVVAIIGILATFLLVNFIGVRQRARDAERKSDLRQIQSALELYRADASNGSYPDTPVLSVCGAGHSLANSDGTVTYMTTMPCDPSTLLPYKYTPTDNRAGYLIVACLENENDSQLDKDGSGEPIKCSQGGYFYTLQNP